MDEPLKVPAWMDNFDASHWPDDEDELIAWLDARDVPLPGLEKRNGFELEWLRVFSLVKEQEKIVPLDEAELAALTEVRKAAFLHVIRLTGNDDLAASVSDDFDLILRAARVGIHDEWLDKLRAEYEAGRFPNGAL